MADVKNKQLGWLGKESNLTMSSKTSGGKYSPLQGDFQRTSKKYVTNKDGFLAEVAENIPAIDYSESSGGALLLEPQSENIILESNDFSYSPSNNGWQYSAPSNFFSIEQSTLSPEGIENAWRIVKTSGDSDFNLFNQNLGFTTPSAGDYTFSVWYKAPLATSKSSVTLSFGIGGGGASASFVSTGDWQRISVTGTFGSGDFITPTVSNISTNNTIFLYGAQVEALSYATSYIPTENASVVRSADVCNNFGHARYFNSEEGVLYAEIEALTELNSSSSSILIGDGSYFGNSLIIQYRAILNTITFKTFSSSVSTLDNLVIDLDELNKVALKYKANDCAFFINGVKVGVNTSFAGFSALDRLNFDRGDGGEKFFGKVKDLQVFNRALTDTELQNLTS